MWQKGTRKKEGKTPSEYQIKFGKVTVILKIRAAFYPPKYNLKSRLVASATDLIPKVMNLGARKKIALVIK